MLSPVLRILGDQTGYRGNLVSKCLNQNVETISFDNQPANLARILCIHQIAVMSKVLSSGAVHMLTMADGRVQVQVPHLSPGVSLIYDLVHDSGMLQSELFTSRSQNLVLAKLPNSGF